MSQKSSNLEPIHRITGAPASIHYPSQDRMGGLCLEFRARQEMLRCTSRRRAECALRPNSSQSAHHSPHDGRMRQQVPRPHKKTYMLIDQQDSNIFPFLRKVLECFFNGRVLGLAVDNEEVPLGVRGSCDMLYRSKSDQWHLLHGSRVCMESHPDAGE